MLPVKKEKVYLLLPVHNRKKITEKFIDCLSAQTYQNFHLILIDDGSIDGTELMVRKHVQSLTTIRGKGDWWWAGSLQQGYLWLKKQKVSPSDLVLIINDDTYFENNFLEIGVNLFNKLERAMILAQCYGNITTNCDSNTKTTPKW